MIAVDPAAAGQDVSTITAYRVDINRVRQIMWTKRMENDKCWWIRCSLCLRRQIFREFRDLAVFRNRNLECRCGHHYGKDSEVGDFPAGRVMVWDDVRISDEPVAK